MVAALVAVAAAVMLVVVAVPLLGEATARDTVVLRIYGDIFWLLLLEAQQKLQFL